MSTAPEKPVPAYIPWETFTEFLAYLKSKGPVPTRVDKSAMPESMPSLTRGQVQSALRFLRLIDSSGATSDVLRVLVEAYETGDWQDVLRDFFQTPYLEIIGSVDLDKATQQQLDERFKAAGVNGQMLLKSVRFYLAGLTAAGLTFSPHLTARRARAVGARKRSVSKKPTDAKATVEIEDKKPHPPRHDDTPQQGIRSYPLYFKGKPDGKIIVPENLSESDCRVIELQMAVLRAYAGIDE